MNHSRILTAALALLGLSVAGPVSAGPLEECGETYGSDSPVLCSTALEFGAQAAFLRDSLRHGGTGATRQKLGGRDWAGLFAAGGQTTSGSFTGGGAHLLAGAQTDIGGNAYGALVYYGDSDTTAPASPRVDRSETLVGPQFTARLGSGDVVTGYLLVGSADYTIGGTGAGGDTVMGSLIWGRTIERPGIDLGPFVGVSAKREDIDGPDRIDARILTLGTSLDGEVTATGTGVRQYFGRVELDIGSYEDSFGSSVDYLAPRIGIGARFGFDSGVALQILGNASVASDDTTIVAAQVGYQFRF